MKDINNEQKAFVSRLFYSQGAMVASGYGNTPTDQISIERLLSGDPFFKQHLLGASSGNLRKKTLVLSPFTSAMTALQKKFLQQNIVLLMKLDFNIFYPKNNSSGTLILKKTRSGYSAIESLAKAKIKQPSEIDIETFFPNTRRDEIYVITQADWQLLCTTCLTHIELLAPYENISFSSDYNITSNASLQELQKLIPFSHLFKNLIFQNWDSFNQTFGKNEYHELIINILKAASNLKVLDIRMPCNDMIAIILKYLPPNVSDIQLYFHDQAIPHQLTNAHDDFLKKIKEIDFRNIKSHPDIITLLNRATNLKNLRLEDVGFSNADLSTLNPSYQLSHFTFQNDNNKHLASDKLIYKLIGKNPSLETADFTHTDNIDFNAFDTTQLKQFLLFNSNLTTANLQALLTRAKKLEEIGLTYCTSLTQSISLPHDLPLLKKIFIFDSTLNEASLKELVKRSPHLIEANISQNPNLRPELQDKTLAELKIALGLTSGEASDQLTMMDADTTHKHETYHLKRNFVGKPHTVDLRLLRKNAYSDVKLNNTNNIQQAFILKKVEPNKQPLSIPQANSSLKNYFKNTKPAKNRAQYLGILDLHVSKEWIALPSVNTEETIQQFYCNTPDISLEFSYDAYNHFYYVRTNSSIPRDIQLEILIDAPLKIASIQSLPDDIQRLIKEFQTYRAAALPLDEYPSGQDYLDAIIKYRLGSCRHRSMAFKYLMQQRYPKYKINIIRNDCHWFVEIYNPDSKKWVRCDLGGYETELKINNSLFAGVGHLQEDQHHEDSGNTIRFANRGVPHPDEYYLTAKPHSLIIQDSLDTHPLLNISHVLKLSITSVAFKHEEIYTLLRKMPALKKLKLNHVTLTDDFSSLDFNFLPELDLIELNGAFIPNDLALDALKNKHSDNIIWKAHSPNLINDTTQSTSTADQTKADIALRATPDKKNKIDLLSILNTNTDKATLITTSHPTDVSFQLLKMGHNTNKPIFLIDKPDQLRCMRPFIKKDGNIGYIQAGPGGDLYDFIQQHPNGTLLLDYSRFTAEDIVNFNSLLDASAKIDGIPFDGRVIGLINPEAPESYKGADFYSRFNSVLPFESTPLSSLDNRIITELPMDDTTEYIDFAGDNDFKPGLLGHWDIKNNQLFYRDGSLQAVLHKHPQQIVLKNAPLTDPDFIRFVREFEITHPNGPTFAFYNGIALDDFAACVTVLSDKTLVKNYLCLNTTTLPDFIGRYQVKNGQLIKTTGHLASSLPTLYLTETLRPNQWRLLLDCAKEYNQVLKIQCAPQVTLPIELSNTLPGVKIKANRLPNAVTFSAVIPDKLSKNSILIDVRELTISDLFDSIDATFDESTLQFNFKAKEGFLKKALSEGKTIVLTGNWPNELTQQLYAFLAEPLSTTGKLIIVCQQPNMLPCIEFNNSFANTPINIEAARPPLPVAYANRYQQVWQALHSERFVFLQGPTGVGKTYFIEQEWSKHHLVFYGENAILDWLCTMVPEQGYCTLFIDEANITHQQWSLFEGLFNKNNPGVFYKGQFYPVSSQHKIIFAGNPFSYGGERTRPKLFDHAHTALVFDFIPIEVTLSIVTCHNDIKQLISHLADELHKAYPDQLILTPREYIMMARLMQLLKDEGPNVTLDDLFARVKSAILKNHLPAADVAKFHLTDQPLPQLGLNEIEGFVITPNMEPAISALLCHLALRKTRMDKHSKEPIGLGGLILEGAPGIGKSELLIKTLVAKGLKEKVDFIHIPVSMERNEKIKLLLMAFHEGLIVIIDEINSSPMLERLLNALLEGHDLEGNPPKNPGFLLLGTQNPITFCGRKETTLPLKHRLQHVILADYTAADMLKILREKYNLPQKIAVSMAREFKKQQTLNSKLCFRDVLRWAKHWNERTAHMQTQIVPLTALPQIGSTCKVVALGNVEQYFSTHNNFAAIPVHKRKTHTHSIRQLAKARGSLQGEILAFEQWKKLTNTLGYETETVSFESNFETFIDIIHSAPQQGNLPMLAFAVDRSSGHPDINPLQPEAVEHAAVITGYDPVSETITLTHWGRVFQVDAGDLFLSNLSLTEKRQSEHYRTEAIPKTGIENTGMNAYLSIFGQAKHIPTTADDKTGREAKPTENGTGFKDKILVVKKPDMAQFLDQRHLKITEALLPNMSLNNNTPVSSPPRKRFK